MTNFVDHYFWAQRVEQEKKYNHAKELINITVGSEKNAHLMYNSKSPKA